MRTAKKPATAANAEISGGALPFDWEAALGHLSSAEARLADLIGRVGPVRLQVRRTTTPFEALARAIVYQQLAGKAAATIHGRFVALFPDGRPLPESLLALPDESLRAAGVSRGKLAALQDLAARTLDGTVPTAEQLDAMDDEAIVERLVRVRGIGRWSAEMLLIFYLGRPDVLPVHDLGVRQGFKLTFRKREMPTVDELRRRAKRWRPFRTVASWYMWRAVELSRTRG